MRIFLDSSILIEYIKGNKTSVLEAIVHPGSKFRPCINHIVYSEFLFHFLALTSRKSPLTLKRSSKIQMILTQYEPIDFIHSFTLLDMNQLIIEESYAMMKEHNLLPNDALIIATCKSHEIPFLATYDTDFDSICEQEGIALISKLENIHEK